ncbi:uncharacterized protein LOC134245598 [Saccostrea cucullata]|uniref:uncharacterized protein LOC134245598 n=1 Tax=Saccostrea cuccullata TaxID=36930 RepID=UPI002ED08A69
MFSWKSVVRGVIMLLITGSVHGRSIFFPVSSCTDISLAQVPIEVYQNCSGKNRVLHCLPNDNDDLGLCCFSITWIEKGRCPYYNNYQGNMDERKCPGDSDCPDKLFKSPLSLNYKGCYKKEQTTTTTTVYTTTSESQTTTAKERDSRTTIPQSCNCSRTMCNESLESSSGPNVIVLVTVFIFILVVMCAVFVFVVNRKKKEKNPKLATSIISNGDVRSKEKSEEMAML